MQNQQKSGQIGPVAKRQGYVRWILVMAVLLAGASGLRYWHDQPLRADDKFDDHAIAAALEAKVAKLAPDERLPTLLKALQDPNFNVRAAVVGPLANLQTPQAIDAVEAAFQDSSSTVREAALEALPKMDRERGLKLELAALVDEDLWIRESAVIRLGATPHGSPADPRAIPTLLRALDDASPVVQTTAMAALRHISGKDWRSSTLDTPEARQAVSQRWKQWWAGDSRRSVLPAEYNVIASRPAIRTDPAPDFHLTDTAGHDLSLASERGKVVLLNFWGTWCPPCRKELPDLIRLDAAYRSKGLEIVGVALSEKNGVDGLRKSCAERSVTYRQALAVNAMLDAYGHIEEVPISVLIDAQGRIRIDQGIVGSLRFGRHDSKLV